MRILWISDSPDTPSGFGNVTRFVCGGLAQRGHQVSIMGWQTKEAHNWNGCAVYPSLGRLASDSLFPFLVRQRPEVVIALADVWWLPYFTAPHVRRQMELTDTPWALYFPIDGDMEGERLPASWVDLLSQVDIPVAMSRYGQRIAERHGVACQYIPHGVDLEVFTPPRSREEAKTKIGAAGKFLVLSDSRNQPRKMLPRLLDVIARFSVDHPECLLHLHTDPEDEFTQSGTYSYDVHADVRLLGLESKVRFTPGLAMKHRGGIPLQDLATYYQAADVHLLASSGEGFGLPTLQAAAAGAVPMAGAYTASRELTEGHGESISIAQWTENEFGIRRGLIDVDDAVARLDRLYRNPASLRDASARSREFAIPYGWPVVVDQWDRLLQSVAQSRRRITRMPAARTESFQRLMPGPLARFPGASVSVKVVERQLGRNEAAILADARRISDVRIPVLSRPCEVGGVKVPRSMGYVGMSPADVICFDALKHIFPLMSGWVIRQASLESRHDSETPPGKDLVYLRSACPEDARFDLAQSVLLLNVGGRLPEALLVDAALYGVPCIGDATVEAQRILWPELAVVDAASAVRVARGLLTNAAWIEQVAQLAQRICRVKYSPDEEDSAFWLRRLHAREKTLAAIGAVG